MVTILGLRKPFAKLKRHFVTVFNGKQASNAVALQLATRPYNLIRAETAHI